MKKIILTSILLLLYGTLLPAQEIEQNVEERLQAFFKEYTTNTINIGTCKLDSFRIDFRKKRLLIYTNERFAYQPLRPVTVDAIYRHLGQILPGPISYFKITLFANGRSIEDLIPNLYRKGKEDKTRLFNKLEYKKQSVGNPHLTSIRNYPWIGKKTYRPLAKSWKILYQRQKYMGMATSTPVLYNRRPVHTIIHFTLPHTHAGKCRSQCIHPP